MGPAVITRDIDNGLQWSAEGREVWTKTLQDGPVGRHRYRVAQCFDARSAEEHARLLALAPDLARFCLTFLRALAAADDAGAPLPDTLRGLSSEALGLALALNGVNQPEQPAPVPLLPKPV
jgi:hypothetical protein